MKTMAHQLRDIQRTMANIQQITGHRIQTWGNHGYVRTPDTDPLPESCGIRGVSDEVSNENYLQNGTILLSDLFL